MKLDIAVLPGDGIGPEVTSEALNVVRAVADRFGHEVQTREYLIGGCALDDGGTPLPRATVDGCLASRASQVGEEQPHCGGQAIRRWTERRAIVACTRIGDLQKGGIKDPGI